MTATTWAEAKDQQKVRSSRKRSKRWFDCRMSGRGDMTCEDWTHRTRKYNRTQDRLPLRTAYTKSLSSMETQELAGQTLTS